MTDTNKISRRLVLTAASVLPLSACVGAMEEDDEGSGVRVLGLTSISNISMFSLDLIAGAGQDAAANWYSISGGHEIKKVTKDSLSEVTDATKLRVVDTKGNKITGDVEYADVDVVGPVVKGGTRAEMLQLLNTWATQTGERFNATLTLLDSNQQVVRTINFFECIPTYYGPPSVRAGDDSLLEERFSFKPERVEG